MSWPLRNWPERPSVKLREAEKLKAILYESNTGYTEKYAKLLAERTGLPCVPLKTAGRDLSAGGDIIFFGWILGGRIQGVRDAGKRWNLRAICGVGIKPPAEKDLRNLQAAYGAGGAEVFLLQGGLKPERLKGLYRLIIRLAERSVERKLKDKPELTPQEQDVLQLFREGGSRVSAAALSPVLDWLSNLRD